MPPRLNNSELTILEDAVSHGISPKVSRPLLLGLAVAIALYVAGDHGSGIAVALTALTAGGAGAASPVGRVKAKLPGTTRRP